MHLIIDIGNTNVKLAFYRDMELVALWSDKEVKEADFKCLIEAHNPEAGIISDVRSHAPATQGTQTGGRPNTLTKSDLAPELKFLCDYNFPIIQAGVHLTLPLTLRYTTPKTLGSARLAAAVAAIDRFPGQQIMIINLGSCLTTDFVSHKNEYLGGTISPGLRMRFKALNEFTGQLPKITKLPNTVNLPGSSTEESIISGVVNGMVAEIDGLVKMRQKEISFFNVILSGGDRKFFAKKLKSRIFAVDNIVLHGLNLMLKHNVQHL